MYRQLAVLVAVGAVLPVACASADDDVAGVTPATCSTAAAEPVEPGPVVALEMESGDGVAATPATAAVDPALSVTVVPPSVVLDGVAPQPLSLVVANPGSTAIADISVVVDPVGGAVWDAGREQDTTPSSVAADRPLRLDGTLSGRVPEGGVTSIVVAGRAGGRAVLGSATVTHPPAGSLGTATVVGGDLLTNDRDLPLSVQVDNNSAHDMAIDVAVSVPAQGARIAVASIDCPAVALPSRESGFVEIVLDGNEMRSSDQQVRIELALTVGGATERTVVTHRFTTRAFSDNSLFSLLGVSSLLLLPGLAAVASWFVLRSRHRRRRRVISPPLPDLGNLAQLVAVVALSAVSIEVHRRLTGRSLYDGYGISTLLAVTIGAAAVALAARWLWSWAVDRMYPVLDSSSDAEDVLEALPHWDLPTTVHNKSTYLVLWNHDGAACLVPPVRVASRYVQTEADSRDLKGLRTKALADEEAEIAFDPPNTALRPVTIAVLATFAAGEWAEAVVPE